MSESAASIRQLVRTVACHGLQIDEGPTRGEPIFHARVAVSHAQQQWERAVRVVGPSLPLLVAHKRPEDHISPLFFAAMSCRTLREALQVTVNHWPYATDACRARLIPRGRAVQLRLDPVVPASLGARVGAEYLLADLARSGRELSGGEWRPTELVLGYRPPISLEVWESVCGVPVRVDPDSPGLVMAEDSLDQPVRSGVSPVARRFFLDVLEWLLPRPAVAVSVADRVTAALGDELGSEARSIEEVAHQLATSTRSLRRQLAAEGTSYLRLLDAVRRDQAVRLMDDARQLKAVAHAVGFSDPRGFRRAFKRWTGLTPRQFRDRREARPLVLGRQVLARDRASAGPVAPQS